MLEYFNGKVYGGGLWLPSICRSDVRATVKEYKWVLAKSLCELLQLFTCTFQYMYVICFQICHFHLEVTTVCICLKLVHRMQGYFTVLRQHKLGYAKYPPYLSMYFIIG